jgi:tRNA/tmRNA/rRNA uracil-C5-methylase (TrmA/RlmC/RlmD family)
VTSNLAPGDEVDVTVGAIAHGGHCVARVQDDPAGRVLFVRHALPGERVRVRITEVHPSYGRGDAIAIAQASPDRVAPPCPYAGPGRCGGCDFQHVSAAAQRRLKAAVVHEQFDRVARLDVRPLLADVAELPGGLLGWRTRTAYAVDLDGRLGLREHRSHRVEVLARCPLGVPGVGDSDVLSRRWPRYDEIEVVRDDDGATAVLGRHAVRRSTRGRGGRREPDQVELIDGPGRLSHEVAGRSVAVDAAGFWQIHPAAAAAFVAALRDGLRPQPDEVVLDLYAGAGLFSIVLAELVGPGGRVVAIEGDGQAAADAAANLAGYPYADARHDRVSARTVAALGAAEPHGPDLVVLDPPRAGAGPDVMRAMLALAPRAVGYVSCDPATLARDVRTAVDAGWSLARLQAFDAFPMTHHIECVAIITGGTRTRRLGP